MIYMGPSSWAEHNPSFFQSFKDNIPADIQRIHRELKEQMIKSPGTKRWTAQYNSEGRLLVHPGGGCSNFVTAAKMRLMAIGYRISQLKTILCSIFDTKKPDHVFLVVTNKYGHCYALDSAKEYAEEVFQLAGLKSNRKFHDGRKIPYIFWAKTGMLQMPIYQNGVPASPNYHRPIQPLLRIEQSRAPPTSGQ
jgi:hypothetical protein